MQEPRHHDAAAESTPQHDDANGVANTAHETTDNDAGHETASQPPEQPEAIVAEAVPVTTTQPPAAAGAVSGRRRNARGSLRLMKRAHPRLLLMFAYVCARSGSIPDRPWPHR